MPRMTARHQPAWRRLIDADWRSLAASAEKHSKDLIMATTTKAHGEHEEHHSYPHGWRRFLYSTNHKDIGTMYLVFALMGGLIGGLLSIGIRYELMHPGLQFFHDTHTFNVFTTAHGLI